MDTTTSSRPPFSVLASALVVAADQHGRFGAELSALLRSPTPPQRTVPIRSATWTDWFTGRRSAPDSDSLTDHQSALAVSVLSELAPIDGDASSAARVVDRSTLVRFSRAAAVDDPDSLLRLWVASMLWSGGLRNGRAPWRTVDGLRSPELASHLAVSFDAIQSGCIELAAAEAAAIDGSSLSTSSAWLWAASLTDVARTLPGALDLAASRAMAELTDDVIWEGSSRSVRRYLRFVTELDEATVDLGELDGFGDITVEHLDGALRLVDDALRSPSPDRPMVWLDEFHRR